MRCACQNDGCINTTGEAQRAANGIQRIFRLALALMMQNEDCYTDVVRQAMQLLQCRVILMISVRSSLRLDACQRVQNDEAGVFYTLDPLSDIADAALVQPPPSRRQLEPVGPFVL